MKGGGEIRFGSSVFLRMIEMNREKLTAEQMGRKSIGEFKAANKFPIVVVLDNIRSMNNVGSVFRTCDAFLVEEILLCGITPKPPHRDIQKTALGATESVAWRGFERTLDALEELRERGYRLLALEQTKNSTSLERLQITKGEKVAIVAGNEVSGVAQNVVDFCNESVEIPQFGTKHSLNVCNSCAIALWQVLCLMR